MFSFSYFFSSYSSRSSLHFIFSFSLFLSLFSFIICICIYIFILSCFHPFIFLLSLVFDYWFTAVDILCVLTIASVHPLLIRIPAEFIFFFFFFYERVFSVLFLPHTEWLTSMVFCLLSSFVFFLLNSINTIQQQTEFNSEAIRSTCAPS